jgi:hypothetical protein
VLWKGLPDAAPRMPDEPPAAEAPA